MNRLTQDGTAEPVSRDQILRRDSGQGNLYFPCSADHVQDWQPYPVDPYSSYMCDHTYIHIARVRISRVRLPILLVVSSTGKMNVSLTQFARENLVSARRVRPSRVRLLISILRLNLMLTYGIPPAFRGGFHLIR